MKQNKMKQKPLYLFLVLLGLLSDWTIHAQENQSNNAQPNILFILIDDMGWKDISCAGGSYYETPNIDKLALQGVRFLNAYSPAPVCAPSRGAIFSGKSPARTKLTTVFKGPAGPDDRLHAKSKYSGEQDQFLEARHRHVLPKAEVIIPQALAEAGYKTGFFGKWHIGECPGYYPDDRGFQVAKGYRLNQVGSRSHWMEKWSTTSANMEAADQDAYVADALTTECVQFIQENKDQPWMAVLSHYLVHSPVEGKPEKLAKYKNKATTDQTNPGYASMVESVDESVGRLIETINNLGLEENTLVIFTSDNGGYTPKNTSNYPLMGGKSFPFEAGMKVPFIVKWPGEINPGVSEERIVGTDIYPTMLAAAGQAQRPDQHADGKNLLPLLTKNKTLKKRPIIFHFPHYSHATGPFSAIIEDNWKLIRFYNDEHGAFLLYNLAIDPEEQNNLAAINVKMRKKLLKQLEKSLQEMKAEMPTPNLDYNSDAEDVKRKHLKYTKELAEKERKVFEARLIK
jgi:arylsulfatase A